MLVDSHAHVTSETYENISQVIENAYNNNVLKIINCGDNIESSKEVISLSKSYDNVLLCSIGIHPEYANKVNDVDLKKLENLVNNNRIISIGEIGLDYHYGKENKDKQIKLFEEQLKLAEKHKLPVIIHSREAIEDTLNILKRYKLKGIIHCFSGSFEIAKEYIKLGYKLGIGGVVTFKNSHLIETIKKMGVENIVLETDSPYLTPEPFRKYKNEPKYIKDIALFIVSNLGITIKELEYITNKNIKGIFDIEL